MIKTLSLSYFPGLSLSDTITGINGISLSVTGYSLADANPLFFVGKDAQSSDILCVVKTDDKQLVLTTSTGNYFATILPEDNTSLTGVLIGGRPIHRPK